MLIAALNKLPGVGPRSAERIALHLVQADSAIVKQLAETILYAREKIKFCEICGALGFYKGPHGVVCKNCAAPINAQSVGMAGGCNPIPLRAQVTDDAVVVSEADIAAGRHLFYLK